MKISDGKTPDRFGRIWPEGYELCDECGQPDNCGDCTHGKLTEAEVSLLHGHVTHCAAWRPERHHERGEIDCGCGWGELCDFNSTLRGDMYEPLAPDGV